jgi:hypothetical protein
MSDDSERIRHTLQLVGYAVLATLDVLQANDLLKADSPLKDLPLVLGRLVDVVMEWPGDCGEDELSWVKQMAVKAKEHGVVIAGAPFGIEERLKTVEEIDIEEDDGEDEEDVDDDDDDSDVDSDFGPPNWSKFDWTREVSAILVPRPCMLHSQQTTAS